MSKFCQLTGALIGAGVIVAGSAQSAGAVSIQGSSCRSYASAAAEQATREFIRPAGDFEQAAPDNVVVIAAGRKYFMPARQSENSMTPVSVGERVAAYKTVRHEEFGHCMFGLPVNDGMLN